MGLAYPPGFPAYVCHVPVQKVLKSGRSVRLPSRVRVAPKSVGYLQLEWLRSREG